MQTENQNRSQPAPSKEAGRGWMGRLVVHLFGAGQASHEHQWLPTIDGIGYADDREIHCAGCNKFMHRRNGEYVEGRNPNRHRCVRPQREIILHNR